jgi:hypothetical protein
MTDATATADELKADIRRLSARATALGMDLHDLAEELPAGWERIPEVAQQAHLAFQALDAARKRLASLG